jgi:hypothetical protein
LGTSKSLYEAFAFTELSREVLQKGGGSIQLQGFELHWKINIDQTHGIYHREILYRYSSSAFAFKSSLGRNTPHCTPIAKQRRHYAGSINQEEQRLNTYILKENKMFQLE